jgi:heme-binding uptake protein ChaN (Tiki superfamily)
MEMKRLQIDYSGYNTEDKKFLRSVDPTPSDEKLTAGDMFKLSSKTLDEVYRRFRTYELGGNGYSSTDIHAKRFKSYVKRHKSKPEDYVRKEAKGNQFLLFGESHTSPKTRSFMARLVPTLKKEGFSYLAVELDASRQSDIDQYMKTGDRSLFSKDTWMNDEYFQILDACRKAKMNVICIDDPASHGNQRGEADEKMFENLKSQVLNDHPDAKVAVYIGRSHINETPYLSYVKDGRLTNVPTTSGHLGYLLETYAPHRSHSIAILDPKDDPASAGDLGQFLTESIKGRFAISYDLPPLSSIVLTSAFDLYDETSGGTYDALIGL